MVITRYVIIFKVSCVLLSNRTSINFSRSEMHCYKWNHGYGNMAMENVQNANQNIDHIYYRKSKMRAMQCVISGWMNIIMDCDYPNSRTCIESGKNIILETRVSLFLNKLLPYIYISIYQYHKYVLVKIYFQLASGMRWSFIESNI